MKTVTFYSYKGGVGRSLLVANMATYLARFNKNVFVLDLDLEAPGLAYKFNLLNPKAPLTFDKGFIDLLSAYATCMEKGETPDLALAEMVVALPVEGGKPIHFLPAGDAPSLAYTLSLSRICWPDLFDQQKKNKAGKAKGWGYRFFGELKQAIFEYLLDLAEDEQEAEQCVLLIDSRTGITEIGGVANNFMADAVVCLFLNNEENLRGAREVLSMIRKSSQAMGQQNPTGTLGILTRLPQGLEPGKEEEIVEEVLTEINHQMEPPLIETADLCIIHNDPALQLKENLIVHEALKKPDQPSPHLLLDVLKVAGELFSKDYLERDINSFLESLKERFMQAPDQVLAELEGLGRFFNHPQPFMDLLRLYRFKGTSGYRVLEAALRANEFGRQFNQAETALLLDAVRENFRADSSRNTLATLNGVERIWQLSKPLDATLGMRLYAGFCRLGYDDQGKDIQKRLEKDAATSAERTAALIEAYLEQNEAPWAIDLVANNKGRFVEDSTFLLAWAQCFLENHWRAETIKQKVDFPLEQIDRLFMIDATTAYQVLSKKEKYPEPYFEKYISKATANGRTDLLIQYGRAHRELDRLEDYWALLDRFAPANVSYRVKQKLVDAT